MESTQRTHKNNFPKFPLLPFLIIIILTISSFVVWSLHNKQRVNILNEFVQQDIKIFELSGLMLKSDQITNEAARLYVLTGEPKWEELYREQNQQLDSIIIALKSISGFSLDKNIQSIEQQKNQIVDETHKAFTLYKTGKVKEAQNLIFSNENEKLIREHTNSFNDLYLSYKNVILKNINNEMEENDTIKINISIISILWFILAFWVFTALSNWKKELKNYFEQFTANETTLEAQQSKLEQTIQDGILDIKTKKLKLENTLDNLKYLQEKLSSAEGKATTTLNEGTGISAGKVEPVDVQRCLNQSILTIEKYFKDKKLNIHIEKLSQIAGSPQELQRAFTNILLNALEAVYTHGEINIVAKEDADKILINITDTGKGLSAEELSKIFEPFYKPKQSKSEFGSDLAIARRIIQHHGGNISLESKLGKGSTFKIELPLNSNMAKTQD